MVRTTIKFTRIESILCKVESIGVIVYKKARSCRKDAVHLHFCILYIFYITLEITKVIAVV